MLIPSGKIFSLWRPREFAKHSEFRRANSQRNSLSIRLANFARSSLSESIANFAGSSHCEILTNFAERVSNEFTHGCHQIFFAWRITSEFALNSNSIRKTNFGNNSHDSLPNSQRSRNEIKSVLKCSLRIRCTFYTNSHIGSLRLRSWFVCEMVIIAVRKTNSIRIRNTNSQRSGS